MYAIVDIETTGGHAAGHAITEVAILLHNGDRVVRAFHTMINPGMPIPVYITALTGISNEMVQDAPPFGVVASEIFRLLDGHVFVAHNVNFDYSFLRYHLFKYGFLLQCEKLCTVRLSRKLFPGRSSYSLGKLCSELNIPIVNRHRAMGDARSTAELFSILLQKDKEEYIAQCLKKGSGEQQLPPHIQRRDITALPSSPGIYYFKDRKGRVIYVGKAINVKKRVLSHFSGNNAGRQRQEFLRNICSISHTACGTELISFIMEAVEIKRLWPANNRALKRFDPTYAIYEYEDQKGYRRVMIDKKKKGIRSLYSFNSLMEGRKLLADLVREFELCPNLCFLRTEGCCGDDEKEKVCRGACKGWEGPEDYNKRVVQALGKLREALPTFLLLDKGRSEDEKSVILMENGQLVGIGYIQADDNINDMMAVKTRVTIYPSNDYVVNLVLNYAARFPEKVVSYEDLQT